MKIHIAQKGDTLWNIAKKYNIGFEQLEKANPQLSSPGAIYPGMKIKVPVEKVPVTNQQDRQDAFESTEEEQLEAETESVEVNNENNEEEEEESLVRSDEPSVSQTFEGVQPKHETQLKIEEMLPPLPPYPTIPKPPFSLPVAPPPPIVNTGLSSSYENHILQKQTESTVKKSQSKVEQTKEDTASTYLEEQQKGAVPTPYPMPQVEYMGDVTQDLKNSQEQAIGYSKPIQYGKEGNFQEPFQAVQGGYPVQQPYMYAGGAAQGYQPKAPCGCGGTVSQASQLGAGYIPGASYVQGYPYGYPMPGLAYGYQEHPYGYSAYEGPYGYQEHPYGYSAYGGPYGYQEHPYGYSAYGGPYGYQEHPYGYSAYGGPYGYQKHPYGYSAYGSPYGYEQSPSIHPHNYYAPSTPVGYQPPLQASPYQAEDTASIQTQAVPTPAPTPAYPFPTASFKGQGYPDYYRDEANTNFGVPPIDEED